MIVGFLSAISIPLFLFFIIPPHPGTVAWTELITRRESHFRFESEGEDHFDTYIKCLDYKSIFVDKSIDRFGTHEQVFEITGIKSHA